MPISGMTLMLNATGGTTVGGTSTTFQEDGVEVKNGIHVSNVSQADFTIRENITFKTRNPQLASDGTYSKAKRSISIVVPKKLADLSTSFNLVRIEVEAHPETTAAELTNLHMLGAQMFTDADVTSFLVVGSLG
jgi:ribosome-interacting GTPase 1